MPFLEFISLVKKLLYVAVEVYYKAKIPLFSCWFKLNLANADGYLSDNQQSQLLLPQKAGAYKVLEEPK